MLDVDNYWFVVNVMVVVVCTVLILFLKLF